MPHTFRLGLTGGIGSGKSTVAQQLIALGADLVDADAIAHAVTAPQGVAIPRILETFGPEFLTPVGALDRVKMRALVFADPSARQRLELLLHPLIALEIQNKAARATQNGVPCIVFDIPLLVESATWRPKLDHVLVVDCTPEVQISRVMARNQLSASDIEKIIATQATRHRRLSAADSVVFNASLTLEQLAHEVREIASRFGLSSETSLADQKHPRDPIRIPI
jgi:dephospho-CoA kinase